MKKWEKSEIVELSLNETAHNWTGIYRDGGYIGDGEISGHLSWSKPEEPAQPGGAGGADNTDNTDTLS